MSERGDGYQKHKDLSIRVQRESDSYEMLAQLAVGKAVQHMLAAHQHFEQRAVLTRHQIERAHRACRRVWRPGH